MKKSLWFILSVLVITSCSSNSTSQMNVFETSASGSLYAEKKDFQKSEQHSIVSIDTKNRKQTIIGFGGAFTEATAHNINLLSPENRSEIIEAYFGDDGAAYSLTRTHMNSCDFSVTNYSYTPVEGDTLLEHFTIDPDRADILPMIKDAQGVSKEGFKIFGSPWSAAPWMKDNNNYVGGKLKKEYYDTWALFFSKYVDAYRAEGIDIWGFTVENEPHGNGNNWESMHYSPEEMTDFVVNHLGPQLEADGKGDLIIMGYDQNRQGAPEWADVMYRDDTTKRYYDGMAVHWYESTYDYFPATLDYVRDAAPDKILLQTEACVDNQVPVWRDDAWYWQKEATDWGYYWREEENRHLHPKYAPVNRYARDIIGCLNHWVQG
jgi:glucosylceramidase